MAACWGRCVRSAVGVGSVDGIAVGVVAVIAVQGVVAFCSVALVGGNRRGRGVGVVLIAVSTAVRNLRRWPPGFVGLLVESTRAELHQNALRRELSVLCPAEKLL